MPFRVTRSSSASSTSGSSGSSCGDSSIIFDVDCNASVSVGDPVRMSSGIAVKSTADSETNSLVTGVCIYKNSSTVAVIQLYGLSGKIYTGLVETTEQWLALAGGITSTPLDADTYAGTGYVQRLIGLSFAAKEIIIRIGEAKVL